MELTDLELDDGKRVEIEFTTEPEAAFNHLMTHQENEVKDDNEGLVDTLNSYKNILLMDGGDGTFDYLYVQKVDEIWSK